MNFWCYKGHFNLDQAELYKELVKKHNPKYRKVPNLRRTPKGAS